MGTLQFYFQSWYFMAWDMGKHGKWFYVTSLLEIFEEENEISQLEEKYYREFDSIKADILLSMFNKKSILFNGLPDVGALIIVTTDKRDLVVWGLHELCEMVQI